MDVGIHPQLLLLYENIVAERRSSGDPLHLKTPALNARGRSIFSFCDRSQTTISRSTEILDPEPHFWIQIDQVPGLRAFLIFPPERQGSKGRVSAKMFSITRGHY
jgi:hypothetical protein